MSRPLDIIYVHRTQGVGAEGAHIMGMVEAFRDLGHNVTMDCLPGCNPEEHAMAATGTSRSASGTSVIRRILGLVADHTPQWLFGVLEVLYNIPLMLRLLIKVARQRPDLVYERYALCTFAPSWLCRWLKIPHVLEVNDSVVIERSRPLKLRRISKYLEGAILDATSLVITISERFKGQLRAVFSLPADKVIVCPNAVSERRFLSRARLTDQARDALRQRHGVHGSAVLGSAGQFVAWHGLPKFVEAVSPLVKELDLFLLFIGDGPTREQTLDAALRGGISDRVTFTGMIPHARIPDYLELLDIAVIPFSNSHGSPMKLMEFMAMGLPVVAPQLPPVCEVLRDGETGRIFADGDMAAMQSCLRELLLDGSRARAMGDAAKAYVSDHLTWRVHASRTLVALHMAGER